MMAVLELSDRRKFACCDLEAAINAWRDNFPADLDARIIVYPRLGNANRILSYIYDLEQSKWVEAN